MTDLQIVVAAVVAISLMMSIGFIVGYLQLRQIHSAVNSNMTAALNKIDELHTRLAEVVAAAHRDKVETETPKRRKK